MTDLEEITTNNIEKILHSENVSNEFYVSMLKLIEQYSGIKKVSQYAKDNCITTQGARRFREIIKFCDISFIFDET